MYHFVKIRPKDKPEEKGFWYFVPNSIEQVQEHFNKFFGQEISTGVKDKIGSIQDNTHPVTA